MAEGERRKSWFQPARLILPLMEPRRDTAEEVEAEFADEGEVLRGMVHAAAGGIFAEIDIEHPMELIFDDPMCSGDVEHALRCELCGEEEPADGSHLGLTDGLAAAFDAGNGGDAGEVDAGGRYD